LILTIPLASWIKINFPNTSVGFIVRKGNRCIAELSEHIDEIFEFDQKANFFTSLNAYRKILKEFPADIFVDVGGNKWGSVAAFILGVKTRLGLKHKLLPWLFLNKGVSQSRSLALMHEVEYNLCLLNPILPAYSHENLPEILTGLNLDRSKLKEEGSHLFQKLFPHVSSNSKKIIIHPGMTGHSLNWSARNYARLGQIILESFSDVTVFFSHTPSDAEYMTTVREQLKSVESNYENRLFYLDGSKLGLSDFIKVISAADAYCGGSTGPTHIAGILGIPFLSIFSPIKTQSAYRWGPLTTGQLSKVVYPDVVCGEDRFCAEKNCPYYDCMGKIEVKEVFESFRLILGAGQVIPNPEKTGA